MEVTRLVQKILRDPASLVRGGRTVVMSQIGDPSAIDTPYPRLWVLMRVMGRFTRLRDLGVRISKPPPRAEVERGAKTHFEGVAVDEAVVRLRRDGIAEGIDLPSDVVQRIRGFAERTPFAINKAGGPETTLAEVQNGSRNDSVTLGEYPQPHASEEIAELALDPVLLEIAERYLGVPPRHMGTRLWWSFPKEATREEQSGASQLYHFDLDDFRFVKFFFYLTDVDDSGGPHIAVLGTHARKRFAHQAIIRRLDDREVAETYGEDRIRRITLPAGRGFAEDTFCIHKGETPSGTPRLLLQFEYGINPFRSGH
jgi:hypothetical protein